MDIAADTTGIPMNGTINSSLQDLLARMAEIAAQDPSEALSLPPDAYTSDDLLALEKERIFRREWICVGRADEISAPGDYFTTEIDNAPIIVVRGNDDNITAMANVCRHRLTVLTTGSGNTEYFSCPYHGWTYDTGGQLITAPRMPQPPAFAKDDCRLPPVRVELWSGFIYLNLDENAAPLKPRLADLTELFANYHVEDMRTVWHKQELWDTNWKVLTENFLEVYHIGVTHPDTLYPLGSHKLVEVLPAAPGYHFYRQQLEDTVEPVPLDPEIAIENPDLTDFEQRNVYVGGVFPSHVFSVAWDWMLWLSLQPNGSGQVKIDVGVVGPVRLPVNQPEYPNFPYPPLVDVVNAEDRVRVEAVQRGATSGLGAQGRLHLHEEPIWGFVRYLVRQLCGDVAVGARKSA